MVIPAKEWYNLPSPGLMFCQTSQQEVLKVQSITDEFKEAFLRNKLNTNVMRVLDTIMATAAEASTDENW